MALTKRQQEIVELQKQGKKPAEIGQALNISTNAVYQQIRRMRDGSSAKAASRPRTAKVAEERPSDSSSDLRVATRAVTPLQALRARRDEIEADIKAALAARDAAQKTLDKAQGDLDRINTRNADELKRLEAAEAALKGTTVSVTSNGSGEAEQVGTPKATRRSSGKSADKPAEAAKPAAKPAEKAAA